MLRSGSRMAFRICVCLVSAGIPLCFFLPSKEASVPLITKVADASSILHGIAYKRFLHDVACADLYRTTSSMQIQTELPNEYRQPIVLV